MALQGTIKDFGLADIFQLIGMQRKTGILTLENEEDTVTVHFFEGQVVGADTRLRNLEDLLGGVLVRTGRVTEENLREALRVQKKTLQRLGYVLINEGFISDAELREALRVQVTQIVYRLFRWREGSYRFNPVEHLEYDREHFVPVSAETILMEGARMIDEWPIIERKIRSDKMRFRKTPAAKELDRPVKSIVETDIDLGLENNDPVGVEGAIRVSPEEREILRLVDGTSTVEEIVDRSHLGEFDVYRTLYELLNRHLLEGVHPSITSHGPRSKGAARRLAARVTLAGILALAVFSVVTIARNPITPWKMALENEDSTRLKSYASRGRINEVDRALRVFYLDRGTVPPRLDILAENGYLRPRDLLDPWGREYGFDLSPGGYRIVGRDPEGVPDSSFSPSRRFSAAQRMMLLGLSPENAEELGPSAP